MRFKKIRFSGGEVALEWTSKESGTEIEHQLKSEEGPAPEFVQALAAFGPLVLKLLELPKAYAEGLTITSHAISETKESRGLVVSATKKLAGANGPLNIHTPHLKSKREEGQADGVGLISDDMEAALAEAEKAAHDFLGGKRSQT